MMMMTIFQTADKEGDEEGDDDGHGVCGKTRNEGGIDKWSTLENREDNIMMMFPVRNDKLVAISR